MRILGISCSPRRLGNTAVLVNTVLEAAKERGGRLVQTELVLLDSSKDLRRCDGADACHTPTWRMCTITEDDIYPVLGKMIDADAIVLGCPVYNGVVTSEFATLAGRTNCLTTDIETGTSLLEGKLGGAIAVGQYPRHEQVRGGGQAFVLRAIGALLGSHSVDVVEPEPGHIGISACSVTTEPGIVIQTDERAVAQARQLGGSLVVRLKTGATD